MKSLIDSISSRLWMNTIIFAIFVTVLFMSFCRVALAADSVNAGALGPAPGTYKILTDDERIRIPFELFRGDIRIVGEVNGRPVRMLIDNGFLWDELLFFGSPTVDSLGLEYDGEAQVSGSGDGDPVASTTASGITIKLPGIEFHDQTAIITPYSSGISNLWWGAEGQVSATFFKHFVVDIDFDNMIITLIEPESFDYRVGGVEQSIKPLGGGAWTIPSRVELEDGQILPLDLMMDLGYGDALWMVRGGPCGISLPKNALPGSLGFGVQGEILGHFGRVRSVELGGFKIADIVAEFVAEDYEGTSSRECMIGMELLSRFNIVFDYPHQRIFLEPNHMFNDPFEYNMSGLAMRRGSGNYLEVLRVHPDSPAEDAGIEVGEEVITINGRAAVDYDVWELRPLLRQEGSTVDLTLLRDGEEVQVTIRLRRLI